MVLMMITVVTHAVIDNFGDALILRDDTFGII
jgi:hypothetical protein